MVALYLADSEEGRSHIRCFELQCAHLTDFVDFKRGETADWPRCPCTVRLQAQCGLPWGSFRFLFSLAVLLRNACVFRMHFVLSLLEKHWLQHLRRLQQVHAVVIHDVPLPRTVCLTNIISNSIWPL